LGFKKYKTFGITILLLSVATILPFPAYATETIPDEIPYAWTILGGDLLNDPIAAKNPKKTLRSQSKELLNLKVE